VKNRSWIWFFIAVVLLVAGLLMRSGPLALVAAVLLLVEILVRLWQNYGLDRVTYRRRLGAERVFCGEEVSFEAEVVNDKLLPLPWIDIRDEIPDSVTMLTGKPEPSPERDRMELGHFFPLMWYEKVTRRYRLLCPKRGAYTFGPSRVHTGDLFGLTESDTGFYEIHNLIVYPKVVPLDELNIPSAAMLGEIRTRRSIHHDPILTLGVREYQSGDSLKHIHWKTSARVGRLQTKVYEPTTSVDIGVFLDVRTTIPPIWGTIPHLTELVIVTAASICYYANNAGYRCGLYINEARYRSGEALSIPPGLHADQLPSLLESLARVDRRPNESMPIGTLVLREGPRLPWGSTVAVISATPTEGLISALHKDKRAGRVVALIVVGNAQAPFEGEGLNIYRVPEDISWDKLTTISLRK
jgi:uncharacterized protein (DUF58 family)